MVLSLRFNEHSHCTATPRETLPRREQQSWKATAVLGRQLGTHAEGLGRGTSVRHGITCLGSFPPCTRGAHAASFTHECCTLRPSGCTHHRALPQRASRFQGVALNARWVHGTSCQRVWFSCSSSSIHQAWFLLVFHFVFSFLRVRLPIFGVGG